MARNFAAASTQHLLVAAAPVTTAPLTMACWFKAADITANRVLMSISDGTNDNAWFQLALRGDIANDPICARTRNGSGADRRADSTAGYTTTGWYHGCAVFASSTSRTVYLNGGNSAENTQSSVPSGLTHTSIGKQSAANNALMNGVIAHAAIWNIALTAADVLHLANGVSPLHVRRDAIVGYWMLGVGSPEPDWSGNKNNMTVTGATVVDNPPLAPVLMG